MAALIAGVIVWFISHLGKRVVPGAFAGLGDGARKGIVTLLSIGSLILIIVGFRHADVVQIWSPPLFLRHINNLLMLIAVYLFFLRYVPGVLRTKLRHPMLGGVKSWAFAHLLVNGDLAGMILFGSMLVWAILDVILINRQEPRWTPPAPGPLRNDLLYGIVAIAIFGGIVWVHTWLGYWPLG